MTIEKNTFENKESNPKFFIDIEFDQLEGVQKFVQFIDKDHNNYIASYPMNVCREHLEIIEKATEVFKQKNKNVTVKGAGFLSKSGDEINLFGKSLTLKLGFKGSEVIDLLQKSFPEFTIQIE